MQPEQPFQSVVEGKRTPSKGESYRLVEIAAILIFLVTVVTLIVVDPSPGAQTAADVTSSEVVEAHAYAMPHQGWAPLTVYFSPFGSSSKAGKIVEY